MAKISNRDVRLYVNRREEFETHNGTILTSMNSKGQYVVYSYGPHFPMYIHDEETNQWFGNSDKYSSTTSRHQSHARPDADDIIWLDTEDMRKLTYLGSYVEYCAGRIRGAEYAEQYV
jgi:hypothetical protein